MSNQIIDDLVENDTGPRLDVTYQDIDVTDYQALELHIKYKPYPLVIDATLNDDDVQSFYFSYQGRVEGTLTSAAAIGATSIEVTSFDDLPAEGEIVIDDEHVLYSSKTGPATLNLASALTAAHDSGAAFEKLPDLREGTWKAEIEVTDEDGLRVTYNDLTLKIDAEIA